jgi:hypothetical protein
VAEEKLIPAGRVSVRTTFVASLEPLLVTVMVYVAWLPAVTGPPTDFVTARSAEVVMAVEATLRLFAVFGSEVVPAARATFSRLPVADADTFAVRVNTWLAPFARDATGAQVTA